jgi:hypothetical protein
LFYSQSTREMDQRAQEMVQDIDENPLSVCEQRELIIAASLGDVSTVDKIIGRLPTKRMQKFACDNTRHTEQLNVGNWIGMAPHGQTPLHFACLREHIDVVNSLCGQWGANPNSVDKWGRTPFYLSCWFTNSTRVIEVLCKRWGVRGDIIINHKDDTGETALHAATSTDKHLLLSALWKFGGVDGMEWWGGERAPKNNEGRTPLNTASCDARKYLYQLESEKNENRRAAISFLGGWHRRLGLYGAVFRLRIPSDIARFVVELFL